MRIEEAVALVTGANRGLGQAFAEALFARGAARVYGGVRNPVALHDPRITPIALDVTDSGAVGEAAASCPDVNLLINNAGIMASELPSVATVDQARAQLEVNYLGTLRMSQAFAPILAANGGGGLVNVLSVMSLLAMPQASTYAASKAAAWSITNALRIELRSQGTQVVGVYCAYIDTEMAAEVEAPKLAPAEVAEQTLDAIANGAEEVLIDEISRNVKTGLGNDLELIYPGIQQQYEAAKKRAPAWNAGPLQD